MRLDKPNKLTTLLAGVFLPLVIMIIIPACTPTIDNSRITLPTYEPESLEFEFMTDERWVSSENLEICINTQDNERIILTTGFRDYKPSWSKRGDKITFFRLLVDGPSTLVWKTALCVINSDGTGFRELSDGSFADFNQTWTRDGSNLIIFNRLTNEGSTSEGGVRNNIYLIDPDGAIGDEQLVSDVNQGYEWAFCGLKDGRIFIDRSNNLEYKSYLLTPNPGNIGIYEEISRPTSYVWHKLSLSPSETKICYMLDMERSSSESYADSVLYYADFNKDTLMVSNRVKITKLSMKYIDEYPRWSNDESIIVYDSSRTGVSQLYAYRLSDGVTRRISPDDSINFNFGNFENTPK